MKSVASHYHEILKKKQIGLPNSNAEKPEPVRRTWRPLRASEATLFVAARDNSPHDIMRALAWGADIESVNIGMDIGSDWTPIGSAAVAGSVLAIRELARLGATVDWIDDLGNTPLLAAAFRGHASAMLALAECGADPQRSNHQGQGLAEIAALSRNPESITMAVSLVEKASLQSVAADPASPTSLRMARRL